MSCDRVARATVIVPRVLIETCSEKIDILEDKGTPFGINPPSDGRLPVIRGNQTRAPGSEGDRS